MTGTGISKVMQSLGRCYVQHVNFNYQRTGTLWEGRYRATLLDSERYLLCCQRYIELNPVRAGLVEEPGEYPWSSYACNALGEPDSLVSAHELYGRLGKNPVERQKAYRGLFEHEMGDSMLEQIREATNKAWVLGDQRFRDQIEAQLRRRVAPTPKGGDRRSKKYRDGNVTPLPDVSDPH